MKTFSFVSSVREAIRLSKHGYKKLTVTNTTVNYRDAVTIEETELTPPSANEVNYIEVSLRPLIKLIIFSYSGPSKKQVCRNQRIGH